MDIADETCVPLVLRRAQNEILRALRAESDVAEAEHRRLADAYVRQAVRSISDNPDRSYDWSELLADF